MSDLLPDGKPFLVTEEQHFPNGTVRCKYVFPDGSSQYVNFRAVAWNEENKQATGRHLADNPDLRTHR